MSKHSRDHARRCSLPLLGLPLLGLVLVGFGTSVAQALDPAELPQELDADAADLLARMEAAAASTHTLAADFEYTVTSAKQRQFVRGEVRLMKPNYARLKFSFLAQPTFPALVASDGEKLYTFTPESFLPSRTFRDGPFDSRMGALQASGLAPGGGTFESEPVDARGNDLILWDAAPIQAFFDPTYALRRSLYAYDLTGLKVEPSVSIDGVKHGVLFHQFQPGNIAGGESSSFDQRLYVAPDGIVRQYVLEFSSLGAGGTQVARLTNVRLNKPMEAEDFRFVPVTEEPSEPAAETDDTDLYKPVEELSIEDATEADD